jgi:phosphohistidine swiveling domain-containing protein
MAGARFVLRSGERRAVERLLAEIRLGRSADELLAWAERAIVGREDAKFALNRRLSAILERLAGWGAERDLAREALAWLTVPELARAAQAGHDRDVGRLRARIAAARARRPHEHELRLGPLIRDVGDLTIVHEPPALPTFITTRTVVAPPVPVDGRRIERRDVCGRIVCVESADPGFEWLLGCEIGGLITRFGGANSHLAVRCVELGIPAALGVGAQVFERVRAAAMVELRCGEGVVRDSRAVEIAARCAR